MPADICARRHRGSPESVEANRKIQPKKSMYRQQVYSAIKQHGTWGMTCEEVSTALGMRYSTVSGRIAELKADHWLVKTCARRRTTAGHFAAVLRALTASERDDLLTQDQQYDLTLEDDDGVFVQQ
jgi:hypothetical protein